MVVLPTFCSDVLMFPTTLLRGYHNPQDHEMNLHRCEGLRCPITNHDLTSCKRATHFKTLKLRTSKAEEEICWSLVYSERTFSVYSVFFSKIRKNPSPSQKGFAAGHKGVALLKMTRRANQTNSRTDTVCVRPVGDWVRKWRTGKGKSRG
jgi:hypothetical protein